MSSSSFSPSSTSDPSSPIPTTNGGGGTPPTATLLFGFLVIFAALFAAFLFLALFWKLQRRRHVALPPEIGESSGGTHRAVPKMWEAWIRDEPSENQWNWESISPLSIDVDRVLSEETRDPLSRSRRPWPFCLFRRRPVPPPPHAQQQQQQVDVLTGAGAEATTAGLISDVRASFVIAMPHADAPEQWRRSEISRVSQVVEQQNWRRKEYAIGIYHPSFREGWRL